MASPSTVPAESKGSSAKFFGIGEGSSRARRRVDVHGNWARDGCRGAGSREREGVECELGDRWELFSSVVEEGVPSKRGGDEGFEVGEVGGKRVQNPVFDVFLESIVVGVSKGLIAQVEGSGESAEVNGVGVAGSGLLEFGEGTTRGLDDIGVSEVLEEPLLEESPVLRPGGGSFVVLEIEGGSDPVESGVLEVGDNVGDLGCVGGVGLRLDFENKLALDDEFPSFRNSARKRSGSCDLGFFSGGVDGWRGSGGGGELSLELSEEEGEGFLLSVGLDDFLTLLFEGFLKGVVG